MNAHDYYLAVHVVDGVDGLTPDMLRAPRQPVEGEPVTDQQESSKDEVPNEIDSPDYRAEPSRRD